ncbi:hypothetical protein, partial [Flavobacterium salmonis]|uniref:hypothetical protein n=1 Tax=Flavobacterium salmonis TaxID=2654844 RepID=UPI003609C826
MKKPTILKIALLFLFFLLSNVGSSQNLKPFVRQYNQQLKGDFLVIGNNILNRRSVSNNGTVTGPNTAYNGTGLNGDFDMRYINIDNGATSGIFSSSSANLTVPNNQAPADPCYRIAYAALYWSGTLKSPADRSNINKVKIKVPNTANNSYQDITGTIIHDITTSAGGINPDNTQAYACFAEITSLLSPTNPNGTYTVANVVASQGFNGGTGNSAGWSLFIVYEDSSLPSKAISTFNGFTARAQGGGPNNTVISGFTTIPTGPVQARFAFAALEGDYGYTGDYLQINGTTITPARRPLQGGQNNFFNSSINSLNTSFTNRVPNSTNTLGFDTGVIDIDPSSNIIKNNDTSATITLGTSSDIFIYYFTAFSVDIIAPKVILTKGVRDASNNDASNAPVNLGDVLTYELGFKNDGNDNARNYVITDELPINTEFNFPTDILTLPTGMTMPTTAAGNQYVQYNATTRVLTFTVPNNLLEINDPVSQIRFKVKVVDDCSKLTNACSNLIKNTAYSNYLGTNNTGTFNDQSYTSVAGCTIVPQSTNFLVGVDACKNRRQELCGAGMTISASGGYKSYSWSTSSTGSPVIGTSQTLTITQPGTYYVYNTANPPCVDLQEIITVEPYNQFKTNPIIEYADNKESNGSIIVCPDNGKPLPKIFLCGANDSRLLDTKITGATSIVWETTTCLPPAALSDLCANEGSTCENQWVSAGPNGPTFNANTAGQYRVTISSGICFNRYYFNVYKSNLTINETHKDIICNNKGNITVDKLTGYEYVLANASGNNITGYQDSNVFDIWNPGTYIVKYRLKGVAKTCEYKTNTIEIRQINLDAKVDNPNVQPLCYGEKGSIQVSASDGLSGYYFALYDGGTLLQQVGPLSSRVHEFSNLTPGKYYEVEVTTRDENNNVQCRQRVGKYINGTASDIKLTGLIIEPLTSCSEGKIKISAQDGNWGFSFFVNGSTEPQASSLNGNTDSNAIIILAPTPGNYTVLVRDSKLCTKTITVNVPDNTKPIYSYTKTDSNCYNDGARIDVNLISGGNGYSIQYSINNGGTFQSSPTFLNLTPGTYNLVVRYGITYTSEWNGQQTKYCTDPAQQITILGPTSAVTASAGVAELAGCGPLQGGQPTGLIRFTNAQGGTSPYQYSFDGGATWQASPEKYVVSSTASYDLRVRDSKGCIYKIPYDIILDPKPEDPVIDSNINPVFNCDGTATATVVVNTPTTSGSTTYTYEYYLKTGSAAPVPNTPITNNVFTNVPSGNHTVIVKYNITTVSTYSNLLQEDFGKGGYTTTPGISPVYCFEDESTPHPASWPVATCGPITDYQINDGKYAVASSIKTNFGGTWIVAKDHTTPTDALGRFLCVNIGKSAGYGGIIYSKPIKDVIENQPVLISLWAENLMKSWTGSEYSNPKLTIQLVDNLDPVTGGGTIVATTDTANPWDVPRNEKWEYKELSLNPGTYKNLSFVIRSYNTDYNGNDVLLDDIWVRQIPKSCGNEKSFPIVIDTNGAFTVPTPGIQDAKCSTSNDGSITINATNFNTTTGFYYSTDNGLNWHTSTTSPVTISGLGEGTYKVIVKHNTTDPAGKCEFRFDSVIKGPQAILIVQVDKTAPTCTVPATITVTTVTGGTGSYQYQLSDGSGIVKPFQSSKTFTNVAQGTYTVLVRDANNCLSPASAPITISTLTSPSATLAATTDWCYTPSNPASLVVTATGGVGPYTYKLDNNTPVTTNTFNNVAPGTHTILVTDSNNCTAPAITNIVIEPQLQLNATLVQDLTCLVDASINTAVTGGYAGPYTYTVSRNGGTATAVASFPYTAALAGNYVFTVTDSKGCNATSNTIVVSPKTTPALTTNKTDITCNNANDGTITVTASNGATTVYTYAIKLSSAAAYTTQSTNQFTGLSAGTYNIKVIDSKGCESAVSNVTIVNPMAVTGNIGTNQLKCSASGTVSAVVTVTASGGSGSYQYSFNGTSNFTNTNTYSTSVAGTVTAYIKDANDCQFGPLSVIIGALEPITDITIVDNGYDCSTTPVGGQVTITAVKTGAPNPFSYQIISGPAGYNATANTTGIFQGLAAGSYVFQATDTQTDCKFTKTHTISGIPAIAAGGSVTAPISCYGGTGNIEFTVSGVSTSGYDYVVKNPSNATVDSNTNQTANTVNLNNLSAGSYTITVTDIKTKCPANYSVTLTQPSAVLSITNAVGTNINCNNDNSQITVTVTGGTPAYTYAYAINPSTVPTSAYASGSVFTIDTNSGANLAWDIYVKDANGCIAKRRVDIISDNTPTVTASVSNQCTGSGIGFTITATGTGLAPLSYSIGGATGTFQTGNTFSVSAGTYTVHVKDANGCIVPSAAVTVYPQLTANAAVTRELSCSATTPQAQITVTASGGRTVYTYEVSSNGGSSYTAMASNVYTTATAGTYTFRVTDSNTPGCTVTTTATVNTISDPTVTATQVNVSCNGGASNGSVTLTGAGGSGGYTYSNNATSGFTATATFTGLAAGSYTFYVKDSKGCTGLVNVTITQPTALTTTASATAFSCNTTNVKQSAVVTVAVPTTGTAPYTYSFEGSAFTGTRTFTVSDNGTDQTINYIVKDNNGCTFPGSVVINRLNPPVISGITHTDIYCTPASRTTSTVTVAKTAGTGVGTTFTYEITAPAASVTSNNTGIFTGLSGGVTYSFKVTDASGCYTTGSHTVPVVTPIAAIATKLNDVYCNGGSTGSIRYDVSQFTTTYSYKVNTNPAVTAQSGASFTLPNLGVGPYNVVFTDETTGCTASTSITITQPSLLGATASSVNANCNVATSKVTVTATGGTPVYTYAYKQDGVAPVASDYIASNSSDLNPTTNTNWDVWVKDANGCTFKVDVTIATDNAPTAVTAIGAGCLGTPGGYTITASATGGTGTLSYSINGGGSYQVSNIFTITSIGTYTIRVKDANGCTADSNPVTVAPQLTLSAVLNKDITCNPAPTAAQITLTPTGGAGSFTYTSSPNTGTFAGNVFTTNTPGNYIFTVTDSNTCSASTTTAIVVTPTVNPVIDDIALPGNIGVTQIQSINCNGDDTAAIAIAIDNTKGLAPFIFNIRNNTTGVDYGTQTSGLSAGVYTITLTDARGCTDTEDITIVEPNLIVVDFDVDPITCGAGGISLGRIIVNGVTGGTPNFTYHVTGVNGYNQKFTNQPGTSQVFDIVNFGLYELIVTDANGCQNLHQNILVASPPDDLDITVSPSPVVCSGTGSALVAVSSSPTSTIGNGPFYFSLYTGSVPSYPSGVWLGEDAVGSKKTTFNNLIAGVTYTFVVYDADATHGGTGTGCYYFETSQFPIGTNSTITVTPLTESNITCKGAANGNVTFTMNHTYGVATPVTYQIYNSQNVTPVGGLVSTIIPASGSLAVNNFGTLPFGNYFVLITEDAGATNAGCSVASAPFEITESAIDLSVAASKIKNVNCNEDGVIAAQAKDGTAPYTYQYLLASATAPTASTAGWTGNTTFATSVTGNYIVYAKDAYGCIKTAAVTLDADDAPIVTPPATSVCYDGTPFTITFSGTVDPDLVGGATYSVNGSAFQSSPSFTFNASGTYNLVIKDGNGCTDDVDFGVYPKLNLSASLTKELDCTPSPEAEITLTTTGGNTTPAANYTYEVSFNSGGFVSASNPYLAAVAGNYVFRVTDANNATVCQTTTSFDLDPITPTVFTTTETNVSCNGVADGTITVNVTSGVGPYEYRLDAGAFQASNVFTGLAAGTTYTITVKDAKSCLYPKTPITITEPSVLAATDVVTPFGCNSGNVAQPAVVTVTATVGTGTAP